MRMALRHWPTRRAATTCHFLSDTSITQAIKQVHAWKGVLDLATKKQVFVWVYAVHGISVYSI